MLLPGAQVMMEEEKNSKPMPSHGQPAPETETAVVTPSEPDTTATRGAGCGRRRHLRSKHHGRRFPLKFAWIRSIRSPSAGCTGSISPCCSP